LNGTHHGVSHQRLQAYLNEFTFRFNRRLYPFNAFRSLLGIAGDVTAPTQSFTQERGSTLHVGGVGKNRIVDVIENRKRTREGADRPRYRNRLGRSPRH
jgi:hypothetical protein